MTFYVEKKVDSMNRIEILAPAGGKEQLIAAVRCGADAVYLGTGSFNARRNAENFAGDGLSEAVSYCHGRGTDVHVTLNTLVYDNELTALERDLDRIAEAGVDAVIIQDLAVLRLVEKKYPTIKRHASTQMTIHNIDGAKLMRDMGLDRVVLSRELSLAEIEKICSSVDIETEVFVHGALCMSCSGACYLSSMLGGRSGNRGLCAQPCRLDFRSGKREYALSLKDMSHIKYLPELANMGVCSFKIEGRMKRPEYVAAAVTACKKAAQGEEYDLESLQAVFSRSGFTDGYALGKRNLDMFGYRRHEDVKAATGVLGELAGLYKKERQSVPVDCKLELGMNRPSVLTVFDGVNTVVSQGNVPQIAKNRPTDADSAKIAIAKTGGTPFYLNSFEAKIEPGLMLPMAELNSLRREALEDLLTIRETVIPHQRADYSFPKIARHNADGIKLRARFEKAAQIPDDVVFDKIIIPAFEIFSNTDLIVKYGDKLICELPSLLFPEFEDNFAEKLENAVKLGLKAVNTDNLYGVKLAKEMGLELHGGYGLNIVNSQSADVFANMGLSDITLSWEMQMKRIGLVGGKIPRGIIAYGRLPLMRFRPCPVQGIKGCSGCDGKKLLKDRKGIEFPIRCQNRMYSSLLNSLPLILDPNKINNVDFITLYFTIENKSECRHIINAYHEGEKLDEQHTNGLYFREIM